MAEAGQYFEHDDHWRVHEEKKRWATDKKYLFAFFMFILFWIGIAIHALNAGPLLGTIIIHADEVNEALNGGSGVILSFVWVAIWLLALYLLMLHHFTKYMIYLTFFMATIVMCILFTPIFTGYISFLMSLPSLVIVFAMYFLMLYTLNKVGTQVVSKIVQDSIKAMTSFPLSFVVTIIGTFLIVAVILFSILIAACLLSIEEYQIIETSTNDPVNTYFKPTEYNRFRPTYVYYLLPIFICCSVWVVFFLNHIVRMILHGIFTSWHRTSDKKSISSFTTLRYSAIAVRYHAGSLAFGSTIFTKIQMLRVIYSSRRDILMEIKKGPVEILCLLVIMANGTANALVACIVHVKNFHESMKHAFDLNLHNSFKYVATRLITQWMLMFGLLIVPLISLAMPLLYLEATTSEYGPHIRGAILGVVGLTAFIFTLTVIFVFNSAIEAVMFCYLEKCKTDNVDDDKSLMNRQVSQNV